MSDSTARVDHNHATVNLLDAPQLEQEEQAVLEGQAPELTGLTFADVVEAMRRIAYHKRKIVEEQAEAQVLIAPLQAEIDRIKAWQAEREAPRLKSIAHHESKAVAYYRLNPPTKSKTIKGPGWSIAAKAPAPKWKWDDDDQTATVLAAVASDLVRHKPVVEKNALKDASEGETPRVRVADGKVYIVTGDGEVVQLPGVTVEEQETQYTVKVD